MSQTHHRKREANGDDEDGDLSLAMPLDYENLLDCESCCRAPHSTTHRPHPHRTCNPFDICSNRCGDCFTSSAILSFNFLNILGPS